MSLKKENPLIRLIFSIFLGIVLNFTITLADIHEHKDHKIHYDCDICVFKASHNTNSSGKKLPPIEKALLPKPYLTEAPKLKPFTLNIKKIARSPPHASF